jgi:type I thyroxine 5'-deiodinase
MYIREAHASDAWQMDSNIRDNVIFATPKNIEEKAEIGQLCVAKLSIEFPALLDNFDNATEVAYTGWPDRLYVIDREGRIAHKSGPGPFGFKPEDVAEALRRLVPEVPAY